MAKQKSRKGKGQYAVYVSESRLEKNRARKRAKHAAAHPNDEQSAKKAGSSVRKAAGNQGFPAQKFYFYDGTGAKFLMPSFTPGVK
jgi:hypothetical protein